MKSKVKRILSIVMTVCIVSTMIPLTAYGADVDFGDDTTVAAEESEDNISASDLEADENEDSADVSVEEDDSEIIDEAEETEDEDFSSDTSEALFSSDEQAVDAGISLAGYNYSIAMVDCGRNYYSVESLESIIDSASDAGMHYVMLALGNDGLRFLLKDMSLTVGDQKYSSYAVTKAIHEGNEKYRNFEVDELTEHDMEAILSYAGNRGVEIIPLINTPGHMDAILNAATSLTGTNCAYSSSARTIDVTNGTATAFTQALLQKYISWFASKGCTMFNMGADEYANDVNGTPHFSDLIRTGAYSSYITYLNTVAGMIENAGMTPMAFNDGIYYNKQTGYGTIDKNILVCYWSSGWSGYDVASAEYLSTQGFKMINTHGDWYWIVGGNKVTADKAVQFNVKSFPGSTVANPNGAMFCIWSDYAFDRDSCATDAGVANAVSGIISNFGSTLPDTTARESHKNVTVADEAVPEIAFNGTLEKGGDTSVLSMTDNTEVCWTTSNKNVIMLEQNTEENSISTNALTDSVIGNSVKAMVVGPGNATITAETATGIQHTQEVKVEDGGNSGEARTEEIKLKVGEKTTRVQPGVNNEKNCNTENYDEGIAKVEVKGADAQEGKTTYTSTSVTMGNLAGNNTSWTKTAYFYKTGNNYYPVYARRVYYQYYNQYYYEYGYSRNDSASSVSSLSSSRYDTETVMVYSATTSEETPASTTITFEGVMPGTTSYTVGETEYTIVVSAKETTENRVLYYTQSEKLDIEAPEGTSVSYEVTVGKDIVSVDSDGTVTAGSTEGSATVVATVKTVNDAVYAVYTYEYKVTAEDLSKVTPLEIEYWITNTHTKDVNENEEYFLLASDAYTEEGLEVKDLMPETTVSTGNNHTDYYWQCRILDRSVNEQTTANGDDETTSGQQFTKVRYYEQKWSVYTTDGAWTDISETNQLIAYYLEKVDICDEVTAYTADWGTIGDGTSNWGYSPESTRCSLSVQVVYEDATTNPATTNANDIKSKTIFYYVGSNRGIGTVLLNENSDYEIYKVTSETGTETSSTSGNYVTLTNLTLDNNEKTVWEGTAVEGKVPIHNDSQNPDTSDPKDNLYWAKAGDAILLRAYVRAKVTEDSLRVHYIDQTDGSSDNEFYNYNIAVKSGTLFDTSFAWDEDNKQLVSNTVKNIKGVTQTVQWELARMTEIGAQYRYSTYECVGARRSDDGKDVYIYYKFQNSHSFVVDYGRPLEITAEDLKLGDTSWEESEVSKAMYGDVDLDTTNHVLVYTPNKVMLSAENLTLTLTGKDSEGKKTHATHTINIYPASTVYYEEGFLKTAGFSEGSKGKDKQNKAVLGEDSYNYGYDPIYKDTNGKSNGTEAGSNKSGDSATFDFTGTGVDIYANTTASTGSLTIKITDRSSGVTKNMAIVNTQMKGEEIQQVATGYNVPVFSKTNLAYGDYTVTITHSMNDRQVNIDGFRVYNTLKDSTVYTNDEEDNPSFLEVRDLQFGTLTNIVDYGKDGRNVYAVGEQVYKDITADVTNANAVITVNGKPADEAAQKALYEKGPKNEVYLAKGSSLTISVNTARKVQLGLKGVDGSTSYSLNTGKNETVSTVDMFYTVKEKGEAEQRTITIKNTGDHILSVTKLKVCDDPNALQPLSVDSVVSALYAAGLKDPEQPTATPTPTVTATAAPTQKPVQQIKLATPKLGKVVSAGYNALKLNWSKVNGADGYRVYVKVNGQWKALGNTKSTTYVHKKLETGKSYTYTVKAYKNTKSGTVWSSYDKKGITGRAALSAPSLRKAKRTSAKKATLSWKKVNGASGYVVYRKTNNGRWQIVKKITKGNITSFTDKKLSKGKKYTYTVRAYRTVGKKNIYSGYNKKGLKVK